MDSSSCAMVAPDVMDSMWIRFESLRIKSSEVDDSLRCDDVDEMSRLVCSSFLFNLQLSKLEEAGNKYRSAAVQQRSRLTTGSHRLFKSKIVKKRGVEETQNTKSNQSLPTSQRYVV